ncbi:MAG TPA: dihydrofolate reductase family protein [Chloroflexota bacterium]|nr:dihydrofolate reductase family protein [Chloroflexota bacterium]
MSEINSEAINKLKQGEAKENLIYGSASRVQQLTNLGLIDEYPILVLLTMLGGRKALFKDIKAKRTLKLVSARPFNSGVVVMTYQPRGASV